nr:pumilio homolog 5-like [Physcomitrium patens]|eukprot:XP_024383152.1 pumilio homolog 5-like [Physcomitrella patens]
MTTESPVMMMGGGMRGNMGGPGEGLRGGSGSNHGSSQDLDGVSELGRLLKGRTRFDNILNSGHVPQRSGSAPPSVEGSLAAMGGLFDMPSSPKGGHGGSLQAGEEEGLNSEEAQRADPKYLVYYYSNINLNPRLPPPLISWNNYRLAHRLPSGMGAGGFGDKKKLRGWIALRLVLDAGGGVLEDDLGGMVGSALGGGSVSFSSSDGRGVGLGRAASASAADFAQMTMQMSRSVSASTADFETAFQGLSVSDMQGLAAAREERGVQQQQQQLLQQEQQQARLQQQQQTQRQQQQQRAQIAAQAQAQAQAQAAQAAQALAYSQALQQQLYSGVESGYRGQPKFGVGGMGGQQGGAAGLQANLGANTNPAAANMYAAAAAAAMYMAQQNPYYPSMNSASVYGPQYGLGGYPMNPAMLAPMMAGYSPPVFDPATAAALASMGVRAGVPGSPAQAAVDMQNLYKYAGGASPQMHDPLRTS